MVRLINKSVIRLQYQSKLVLLIFILSMPVSVFSQQTAEEFQIQQQQAFENYENDNATAFAAYKADVEAKWKKFLDSTREEWVSYSDEKETKRVVNFEKGYIEIETLIEVTEPDPSKKAKDIIGEQVQEIFKATDDSGNNILANQVSASDGKIITTQNAVSFAKDVVLNTKISNKHIVGSDNIERILVKVHIPMVPNHLKKRAEIYVPAVKKYCKINDLDVAMVMALMQTESYFNPNAKSSAPAFGLMQLVPKSGGREAYRFVYGEDIAPSQNYLYNPQNNIILGTGYLRKMRNSEFKDVKNSQNALYCIVCAYNTGPSNVAKAITGNRDLKSAVIIINAMTPEELYAKLVMDLPYEETRDYIRKIVERTPNYVSWR